ncbi:MAG: hypothetical protein HY986_06285 [Candidatus Melainabacteria bacterium]|nr:hypothetical protein [Candidatus Melainabacteria bacterium]
MTDHQLPSDSLHKSPDQLDRRPEDRSPLQEEYQHLNIQNHRSDIDYWQKKMSASPQSLLHPLNLEGPAQDTHRTRGLQADTKPVPESQKLKFTPQQDGYTVSKTADDGEIQILFYGDDGDRKQTIFRPDGTSTQTSFDRTGQTTENIESDPEGHYTKQVLHPDGSTDIEQGQGTAYVQNSYDRNGNHIGTEEQWQSAAGSKHRKTTDNNGNWHQIDSSEEEYKDTIGKANGDFDSHILAGEQTGIQQTHIVKPDGATSDEFTNHIDRSRKQRETDPKGNYTEMEWQREKLIGSTRHRLNEDGSVSDTYFDATGNTNGNRETKPDGSFCEQRLGEEDTLVIRHQDSQGNFKQLTHSKDGEVLSTIEHRKQSAQSSSELELNKNGSLRNRWTFADGSYNEQSLNGLNKQLTIHEQDGSGNFTATIYDQNMSEISRTIHEQEQSGAHADTIFDPQGNIVRHRDTQANGSFLQQERLSNGVLISELDAERGVTFETRYDLKGTLKSESIAKSNHFSEKTFFDSKGKYKQQFKNSAGEQRETTGDAYGNFQDRIFQKDESGKTVLQGKRIHHTDGKGGWTTVESNSNGQRLKQFDANKDGSHLEQTWHKNGTLKTVHSQDAPGNFRHLSFSETGVRTSETIQTKNADGSTTITRFDGTGRIISNRESKQDGSYTEQYLKPDGSINIYSQTKGQFGFEFDEQEFDPSGERIMN